MVFLVPFPASWHRISSESTGRVSVMHYLTSIASTPSQYDGHWAEGWMHRWLGRKQVCDTWTEYITGLSRNTLESHTRTTTCQNVTGDRTAGRPHKNSTGRRFRVADIKACQWLRSWLFFLITFQNNLQSVFHIFWLYDHQHHEIYLVLEKKMSLYILCLSR